jgi:hypothetical protein
MEEDAGVRYSMEHFGFLLYHEYGVIKPEAVCRNMVKASRSSKRV